MIYYEFTIFVFCLHRRAEKPPAQLRQQQGERADIRWDDNGQRRKKADWAGTVHGRQNEADTKIWIESNTSRT